MARDHIDGWNQTDVREQSAARLGGSAISGSLRESFGEA
jgi:hypothetical protein